MNQTNFEESERAGDITQSEIDTYLAKQAHIEASDIAYEAWRDQQAYNLMNRGR